jgi:hypothetical protein
MRANLKLVCFSIFFLGMILVQANPAQADSGTATLIVRSAVDGKFFDGMWAEIKVGSNLVHSGFTPLSYNATAGTTYTIFVSDYGNMAFQSWEDGNKNYFKSVTPTSDVIIVAQYLDKSTDENTIESQRTLSVPTQANLTEPSLLPVWLRDAASSWLSGNLSDGDFVSYLQRLVDQKILTPPPPQKDPPRPEGFSTLQCKKGERYVEMLGKYTNGGEPYEIVSLRMVVLDSAGEILASGSGTISHIKAHETKYFNVVARYHEEFASCDIQVESVLAKLSSKN